VGGSTMAATTAARKASVTGAAVDADSAAASSEATRAWSQRATKALGNHRSSPWKRRRRQRALSAETRCALLLVLASGCIEDAGTFRYGMDLAELELRLTGPTMAVHPDTTILQVKENPFARYVGEARWELLGEQEWVGAFYAWGSLLAQAPEGEPQYYTAVTAHTLYSAEQAETDDLVWVRQIAIGGYQSVLDNFPEAVTYDASGTFTWRLAPLAYQGILDLGGTPQGGWIQVQTADGGTDVVQP
jgi:hypothetical protein